MRAHGVENDRYDVIRRLGSGGMGVVFEALDRETGELCALKTISGLDPQTLYRFKNEFRSLADLSHPNLVRLYELVAGTNAWFFTMELVDGTDFHAFVTRRSRGHSEGSSDASASQSLQPQALGESGIRSAPARAEACGPPPAECALAFDVERLKSSLGQLADALEALHAHGHIHRDLKDSNVMVARDGRVVLLDFGLVAPISHELGADHRTDDQIVGTVSTMAPEQATRVNVGVASDWYSVGAMMFHAMTGHMPFEGTVLAVLAAKQVDEAPDPRALVPAIPASLAELCMGLLARDSTTRLGADAIREVVGPTSARAALRTTPRRARTFVGRKTELAMLRQAFASTAAGTPRTIVFSGESGIGKTSLVQRFVGEITRSNPDAVVLTSRCRSDEAVPFQSLDGIVDGLSHALKLLDPDEVRRMAPADLDLLMTLFPVLERVPAFDDVQSRTTALSVDEKRSRAFSAFRALVRGLAERVPTIVVVEDLQRADLDGLVELQALSDGAEAPRMLLLGTARAEGPDERPAWRRVLRGGIEVVDLPALDAGASMQLFELTSSIEPDEAWGRVIEGCGGRPLHIIEIARAADGGSSVEVVSYEAALSARLERLDSLPRELLAAVCISPIPVAESTLSEVLTVDRADTRRAVDTLVSARLLTSEQRDGARFLESHHDRITKLVRSRISSVESRAMLQVLDQRLVTERGPDDEARVAILRLLDEPSELARLLLVAGRRAHAQFAFDRAAHLLQESVDTGALCPHDALSALVLAGECLDYDGELLEAARAFHAAAALEPVPVLRAEYLARASHASASSLDLAGAGRSAGEALRLLGSRLPTTRIGLGVAALGFAMRSVASGLVRSIRSARSEGTTQRLRALHRVFIALQYGAYLAGDHLLSFFATMGLLKVGFAMGPSIESVESRGTAAVIHATLGFARAADRAIERAALDARAVGSDRSAGKLAFFSAVAVSKLGRYEETERIVENVRSIAGATSGFEYVALCGRVGWLLGARGRFEEAAMWYDRAFERTPSERENHFLGLCRDVQAGHLTMLDRPADARERNARLVDARDFQSIRGRIALGFSLVLAREDELESAGVETLVALHEAHVATTFARGDEELLGFCAIAYLRVDAAMATSPKTRTAHLSALRAARGPLVRVARCRVHAPHLPIVDAAIAFIEGRSDDALRRLDEAEAMALAVAHPWATLESSLVRARVHHARGEKPCASRALAVAEATLRRWPAPPRARRVARVAAELGLSVEGIVA